MTAEGRTTAAFDQARFRQVLGRFPTGVTVVTAVVDGRPVGLTVSSFTSVSLDPPLVAFCVARASHTWAIAGDGGRFCVNILAEDQEAMARAFTQAGPADRFSGVGWHAASSGAPVLDGVLAWVDCVTEAEHDGGDHRIVVGRVRDLGVARDGLPLVFYRSGYGRFEP